MSEHYTDHRRWSYISKAWIFRTSWNDQEEIAFLSAERDRLKADFTELREEKMIDNAAWESTCNRLKAELAQAREKADESGRELERRGQAIADAMGRYRGTLPLIDAVKRLADDYHEVRAELADTKQRLELCLKAMEA